MKQLYLHIGTAKTGTTAIQNFMYENRKVLEKYDCISPEFDVQYKDARKVRNGHWLADRICDKNIYENCMDTLFQSADQYSKVILSDEGLWNCGGHRKEFWEKLKSRLEPQNIELKVIVYLRRQDTYIYSYYAQKVKETVAHMTYTFPEFLLNIKYYGSKNHLDYYDYLHNVAEIIGKENLIVRVYEQGQFDGDAHNIISDFFVHTGMELTEEYKKSERVDNISYEDSIIEAKRLLNQVPEFVKKKYGIRPYLEQIQKELKGRGRLKNRTGFTAKERVKFLQGYKKSNAKVAREFLDRQDGRLFFDMGVDFGDETLQFSRNEIENIFASLIEINNKAEKPVFPAVELKKICNEALEHFDKEKPSMRRRRIVFTIGRAKRLAKRFLKA